MKIIPKLLFPVSIILFFLYLSGCSSSSGSDNESETPGIESEEALNDEEVKENVIFKIAKLEQQNEMYSPEVDSACLYWVNNELIILNGSTKCNIFALNVLYKSGYKTPDENTLTADLFDTTLFADIFPVIGINDISNAMEGDIVVWKNHVIIFEEKIVVNGELYAKAYWAGTSQMDNGNNIINNVCYGKYRLDSEYVVRRPVKK